MPKALEEPKKPLGAVTAVLAAFAGIFMYGQDRTELGTILVFFLPVVVLALYARMRAGLRGWIFLAVGWVIGILGLGVLLD